MTDPPRIEAPAYLGRQTEKEFQRTVVAAARQLGWLCVHFRQMVGNPAGWPDLVLIRGGRVIFAELKRQDGELSRRQREWIAQLEAVGADVRVWRPGDWESIEVTLRGERA